ncbi:hypothetical protein VP01_2178g1 [Puccinia sorghi]|uniref:Uncharacterized protein n=1 Tax=Puccinia sorghi TaxID=27349 RepID=A0A0L6V9E2_9BASI|nr:hypothetical protein VP01_2178g1 [Puccinia sorghi]
MKKLVSLATNLFPGCSVQKTVTRECLLLELKKDTYLSRIFTVKPKSTQHTMEEDSQVHCLHRQGLSPLDMYSLLALILIIYASPLVDESTFCDRELLSTFAQSSCGAPSHQLIIHQNPEHLRQTLILQRSKNTSLNTVWCSICVTMPKAQGRGIRRKCHHGRARIYTHGQTTITWIGKYVSTRNGTQDVSRLGDFVSQPGIEQRM